MNNPINPNFILQQMMKSPGIANNPIAKNAIELYQKGDKQGLNELANNLCKEKGTSLDEMTKNIRSQIGM